MRKILIKNKFFKLISVIVLLLFVILTFSACAQVRVMTITNEDNTIDELVSISIDMQVVHNFGYDVEELKRDISIKSQAQAQIMIDKLNQKIFNDLLLTLDSETVLLLNGFKDGIEIIKSEWQENNYIVGVRFKNVDVYRYYYGIKENVQPEIYTEKHFFYNKLYYYASTMYVKHQDLFNSVSNYYETQYPGLIATDSNDLLYTYKTDLRRQHSDADFITKQNGEYYHTWIVDKDNLDEPIMLYYNVANPESFIIVGFAITLIVTAVLLGIGYIKSRFNKNKQKDDEN